MPSAGPGTEQPGPQPDPRAAPDKAGPEGSAAARKAAPVRGWEGEGPRVTARTVYSRTWLWKFCSRIDTSSASILHSPAAPARNGGRRRRACCCPPGGGRATMAGGSARCSPRARPATERLQRRRAPPLCQRAAGRGGGGGGGAGRAAAAAAAAGRCPGGRWASGERAVAGLVGRPVPPPRVCGYCCAAGGQGWRLREPRVAALPPSRSPGRDYGVGAGRRLLLGVRAARIGIAFGGSCSLPLPCGPPPLFSVRSTGEKINAFTGCRKSEGEIIQGNGGGDARGPARRPAPPLPDLPLFIGEPSSLRSVRARRASA